MARGVARVNGRNGESMWKDGEELSFRTGGKVRKMGFDRLRTLRITNAEEARTEVCETELVPVGCWTDEMPASKGKFDYLLATSDDECWVMEVAKSQERNAQSFVEGIRPREKATADDYKLYTAIQTPLGGVFAIGSIVCVLLAIYFVFTLQMSIVGILFGVAAIVMFVNVK